MYYFAYGSNLNRRQMKQCCPDSKPLFVATLPNYQLIFVGWSRELRGGVATLKSFRGGKVLGAIYDVSEADLRRLDRYEGYPREYTRINITVFDEDNQPVEAFAYIKTGQLTESKPSQEYLAVIQQGYRDWRLV